MQTHHADLYSGYKLVEFLFFLKFWISFIIRVSCSNFEKKSSRDLHSL